MLKTIYSASLIIVIFGIQLMWPEWARFGMGFWLGWLFGGIGWDLMCRYDRRRKAMLMLRKTSYPAIKVSNEPTIIKELR